MLCQCWKACSNLKSDLQSFFQHKEILERNVTEKHTQFVWLTSELDNCTSVFNIVTQEQFTMLSKSSSWISSCVLWLQMRALSQLQTPHGEFYWIGNMKPKSLAIGKSQLSFRHITMIFIDFTNVSMKLQIIFPWNKNDLQTNWEIRYKPTCVRTLNPMLVASKLKLSSTGVHKLLTCATNTYNGA